MPASRPKPKRTDTRLRVQFSDGERTLLRDKAGPGGLKQAAFVRSATLAALAAPQPAGRKVDGTQRRTRKARTYFSDGEQEAIAASAKAHGLTVGEFQRMAILLAAGVAARPRKKKVVTDDALHAISANTFELRAIGRNFNQLVKKANEGAFPIASGEVQYFKNQLQVAISKNAAAVEVLLA